MTRFLSYIHFFLDIICKLRDSDVDFLYFSLYIEYFRFFLTIVIRFLLLLFSICETRWIITSCSKILVFDDFFLNCLNFWLNYFNFFNDTNFSMRDGWFTLFLKIYFLLSFLNLYFSSLFITFETLLSDSKYSYRFLSYILS
jgi:hypothetical protein